MAFLGMHAKPLSHSVTCAAATFKDIPFNTCSVVLRNQLLLDGRTLIYARTNGHEQLNTVRF